MSVVLLRERVDSAKSLIVDRTHLVLVGVKVVLQKNSLRIGRYVGHFLYLFSSAYSN